MRIPKIKIPSRKKEVITDIIRASIKSLKAKGLGKLGRRTSIKTGVGIGRGINRAKDIFSVAYKPRVSVPATAAVGGLGYLIGARKKNKKAVNRVRRVNER